MPPPWPSAASSSSCRFPSPTSGPSSAAIPDLDELLWVQEEPENMGAWEFVRPQLTELVGTRPSASFARPRSASSAEGSVASHTQHQERLIRQALEVLSATVSGRS